MNIFDCAIKIQEETREYYEGLKVVSKNPQMKTLFSILAASTTEHRNNLLRLKSSIEPERAQVQPLDGTACSFRPLLTVRELLEKAENDPDLYQFTVREEEQEIHFYEELASLTADDATGSTLLLLAEEERRHLETVENIYAFVEEPETYLESGEFSNRKEL